MCDRLKPFELLAQCLAQSKHSTAMGFLINYTHEDVRWMDGRINLEIRRKTWVGQKNG